MQDSLSDTSSHDPPSSGQSSGEKNAVGQSLSLMVENPLEEEEDIVHILRPDTASLSNSIHWFDPKESTRMLRGGSSDKYSLSRCCG